MSRRRFCGDSRAVAPVVGFILVIGMLILLLAIYQAQVVPQQNAETEFEHHEDVQNELRSLHSAISAVSEDEQPRFQSVSLGTTYQGRTLGVNPAPPAGTIQTEQHNITIANESGSQTNISTQFIHYQPGYNELGVGSTWYEHSVLYLDERERGNSVHVLEDQQLVEDGNVTIVALQNEFQRTGTGRVTFELYPPNTVENASLPGEDGNYTVTVPTRVNGTEYWDDALVDAGEIYQGVDDTGDGEPDLLNLSVEPDALELNSVGIQIASTEVDEGAEAEHDYGEQTNYRDGDSGDATQPEDPSGEIENPSNVNEEDGETSTALSAGGEEDLKVGFALPPTDESAETYKMRFVIEDIQVGDGDFGFYLVNSDGEELTERQVLEEGDNTYGFDDDEEQAISDSYDDLYLILDSDTSGQGNREMELDYFELIAE